MVSESPQSLTGGPPDETPEVHVRVPTEQRRRLNAIVLLVLSGAAAVLLGSMLLPFLTAIMSAVVLTVLAHPAHRRVRERLPWPWLAALVSTAVLLLVVVLPFLATSVALFNALHDNADVVAQHLGDFLAPGGQGRTWLDQAAGWLGISGERLADAARAQVTDMGHFLAGQTVGILTGIGGGLIQTGVALFTLFYLLRDGEGLLAAMVCTVPLEEDLTESLLERSNEIIHATMFGHVIVGIAQGALGGLLFWALGVPGAVLWGSVMGVLGLLPVLGTPVVWLPAAVILFFQGHVAKAIVMVAAGTLIVSTVDNVLRATVVGERAQLHPLVIFFSALGGILLFGIAGLFLGPVLFVVSVTILEVTRAVLAPDGTGKGAEAG